MKKPNDGRPSLLEFLSSIKFSRQPPALEAGAEREEQFARLRPSTRRKRLREDALLIRSAN